MTREKQSPHTAKINTGYWKNIGGNPDGNGGKGRYEKDFIIRVVTQPPRSPELNLMDLCVFKSIKADLAANTVRNGKEGLWKKLKDLYDAYVSHSSTETYLALAHSRSFSLSRMLYLSCQ